MGNLNLPRVEPGMTPEQLGNLVGLIAKEVNYLMDGMIGNENIRAKSIQADRIDVKELSAFTADIGHITAGLIEGIVIKASQFVGGTINIQTDATIGNNVYLGNQLDGNIKSIRFSNSPGSAAYIRYLSGDISINADGFIALNIGSPQGLVVNNIIFAEDVRIGGQSVLNRLNNLENRVAQLESRPFYPPPSP
ncbi:hypothetical protein [Paenibacillus lutrae]|uniref:Uncharacterized protein n=1 Tax=Paenibacillus lutrae TaxID=2078573 RepID=A0A7X3FIE0_9BACL|nr:hypothetical protein [Paenibacillus lutrae]MVP00344.1 hypothetical protein [Paenibacillus lutrae]